MEHRFSGGHDGSVQLVTGDSFAALAVKAIMDGCPKTAQLANATYAASKLGVGSNITPTAQGASNHVPNAKAPSGPSTGIV